MSSSVFQIRAAQFSKYELLSFPNMSEEQLLGRLSVCELRLSVQQSHVPGQVWENSGQLQDVSQTKYIYKNIIFSNGWPVEKNRQFTKYEKIL